MTTLELARLRVGLGAKGCNRMLRIDNGRELWCPFSAGRRDAPGAVAGRDRQQESAGARGAASPPSTINPATDLRAGDSLLI
jgi:hypothetical protein